MRTKLMPAVPPGIDQPKPVKDPKIENIPSPISEPQEKQKVETTLA